MMHSSVLRARVYAGSRLEKAKRFYRRYEKYALLLAFAAGFAYDSLTLTRIDLLTDNLILLGYIVSAGALVSVIGMAERGRLGSAWLANRLDLIAGLVHFLLGGLLSSYVVFYFKSAAFGKSLIFVGLLAGLMIANEFFPHRLRNFKLLCALYFFCCYAFLTFFLPVITGIMSDAMFIASGLLSLVLTGAIVAAIYHGGIRAMRRELLGLTWPLAAIFAMLLFLYFQNWIPPVPLALKEGGIYRSVRRVGDKYEVSYSRPRGWQFWRTDESRFAYSPGDTVYCFAAVFAPTALSERIAHHWQRQIPGSGWVTTDALEYDIVGGRDGGYRGYTFKKNITPGHWRIEVKTADGRLLGRISFEVVPASAPPASIVVEYR